ncbi:MAG TPA: D-2-hydroxyacid dehydrogenase [Roseiflexaceae bacterium]|nr:D-2-hydroxyacid dehydrogenase [Roseiflexaceae bacterium]HMP38940.1 D-2-hydroxyacid dehydrogenase [Roseiflexaceae bacterium]
MNVLITTHAPEEWAGLPAGLRVAFCGYSAPEIDRAMTSDTEILVTDALPTALERCSGLRWVQLLSAGANQLIGHPLAAREILFSSAAGISAVYIAEHVVARVLYHTKELRTFERLQHEHSWPDRSAMARPSLRGQMALIVGYGGVGRETARLLSAFGMRIIAVTPDGVRRPYRGYLPYPAAGDPAASIPEQVITPAALHEVLPVADVLVLAVPLTPATRGMIDAAALAQMRSDAILVNVARGAVVDTSALLAALDARQIAYAYLDVFEQEPLPPDSPLWNQPRVSITAHMAGVMPDDSERYRDLFLQNLVRYRAGEMLLNQLDRRAFQ